MSEKEKLMVYFEKLKMLALQKVEGSQTSAIVALKESLHFIEGEMKGY